MPDENLTKAPIVEAILEVRWKLKEISPGIGIDPNYKILVGRLYDGFVDEYPFHEALPTATMPDEMVSYVVQHRFRKGNGEWPLIQVGPGIITVNDTKGYNWNDFRQRGKMLLDRFYEIYPNAKNDITITNIQLRYIDAVNFKFLENDPLAFITDNLRINLAFPKGLFDNTPINKTPSGLNAFFSFPITKPKGNLNLRIGTGVSNNEDVILWETIIQTDTADVPKMPDEFEGWFRSAHEITHNLFFHMIEGPLRERFK